MSSSTLHLGCSSGCRRIWAFFFGALACPAMSPPFLRAMPSLLGGPLAWSGGSWLGCLDLPAMEAVSIWELAAYSGSSWMSQAPNLHFARQLLNAVKCNLTDLTTRSTSFSFTVSSLLDMRMCQKSSCSWSIGRCSSFVGVLVSIF